MPARMADPTVGMMGNLWGGKWPDVEAGSALGINEFPHNFPTLRNPGARVIQAKPPCTAVLPECSILLSARTRRPTRTCRAHQQRVFQSRLLPARARHRVLLARPGLLPPAPPSRHRRWRHRRCPLHPQLPRAARPPPRGPATINNRDATVTQLTADSWMVHKVPPRAARALKTGSGT